MLFQQLGQEKIGRANQKENTMPRLSKEQLERIYQDTQKQTEVAKEEGNLNLGDAILTEVKADLVKNNVPPAEAERIAIQQATAAEEGFKTQKARVTVVFDNSGSFDDEYQNGTLNEVMTRFAGIARTFDDDGSLDCYIFDDKYEKLGDVTPENCFTFVDQHILPKRRGGTAYAPVINAIVRDMGGRKGEKAKTPVFVLFVTDGDNQSEGSSDAEKLRVAGKAITEASEYPIFFCFLGVDNRYKKPNGGIMDAKIANGFFKTLAGLDTLTGRKLDNASFFALEGTEAFGNNDVLNAMMAEFPRWCFEARGLGMIE